LDGTQVSVEVAGSPAVLPDEPDQAAIMVVAIDTTERVAAREQIERLNADLEDRVRRRTAELEITVRELEAFSYSVSHDLRAPLRHIDGFADLLRQSAGNQLDAASREYLNIVTESAREMGKLIEALLSFSRLARAHLGGTPVKLRQLLDGILHDLRYELEGRQIQWTLGDLPEVYGDSTLLRQVLFNLLSNSIKYTRPRAVAKIEVGATHNPTEHIIFVKDNGVGFDMEFASKLFGVFQRLHPSADFEGIGIGLANVRRIVQRHGGRTWAEAAPDQGATFYFSLPTSPVPAAELAGTGGT
jgi:light-regulated signal transduction histidine kinase (bacteriophytochrome)